MALDYQNVRKTAQPAPSQPTTVGAPAVDATQPKKKAPVPKSTPAEKLAASSTTSHPRIIQKSLRQSSSGSRPPAAAKTRFLLLRDIFLYSAPSIATESSQPLSQYSFSSQLPFSQAVRAPYVATRNASTSAKIEATSYSRKTSCSWSTNQILYLLTPLLLDPENTTVKTVCP
ncbi:hypothetical protein BDZ89DRAFT_1236461 [Hymenopellis radicata]|nr:hypothetical protein BDZ89DRAFT_1236461 [Hymenopellis radicata]